MPVGVNASDLDPTWIADAESFTAARGEAAHQSGRVQQRPDASSELARVRKLATGIAPIDKRLLELRHH
jgi:hypothetical protein